MSSACMYLNLFVSVSLRMCAWEPNEQEHCRIRRNITLRFHSSIETDEFRAFTVWYTSSKLLQCLTLVDNAILFLNSHKAVLLTNIEDYIIYFFYLFLLWKFHIYFVSYIKISS